MGVRATFLADAARLTGYPVNEIAGWRGRGHGDFRVIEGVVDHHTADGPTGIYPSLGVVRDGRAGLAGPLANLGLGRDGTIFVIADGVGWHAGASRWAGYTDLNDEFIGIEAESTGTRDDWTPAQRDCYPRLNAALCFYLRRGSDRVCGHRECATPAGRKIDPAFWDLNAMRARVAWYLADPVGRIPRFAVPASPPEDDLTPDQDRMLRAIYDESTQRLPNRRGPDGANRKEGGFRDDTVLGYAANADGATFRNEATLKAIQTQLADLAARPAGPAEIDTPALVAALVAAIADNGIAQQVVDALAERLAKPAA